jgi:hypothetical protein
MTTIEPYDEAKIVSLWTEIYRLQELLCYYPESAIIYAPPSGHQIDEATCERLNISPVVISLMKKLPYPRGTSEGIAWDYPIVNNTTTAVYTEPQCIVLGRDPDNVSRGKPVRKDFIKPTQVALTLARFEGISIILDTDESMYRCPGSPP